MVDLTKKEVLHIAKLANIPLSEREAEILAGQLSETLGAIETLRELKAESLEPTFQTTGLENVTREDEICPSLSQSEALKNSPVSYNGYFKVKAIFD